MSIDIARGGRKQSYTGVAAATCMLLSRPCPKSFSFFHLVQPPSVLLEADEMDILDLAVGLNTIWVQSNTQVLKHPNEGERRGPWLRVLASSWLARLRAPATDALEPQAQRGVERRPVFPLKERPTEAESGFDWPPREGERRLNLKALP